MKYLHHIFLGCLVSAGVYGQTAMRGDKFTLTGKVIGKDTGLVMFWYVDKRNETVLDTLKLNRGSFRVSGTINLACEAILWTDLNIHEYDDPTMVRLLLVPSKISILYDTRDPLNPTIAGSELIADKNGHIINYEAPQANDQGLRNILDALVHVNKANGK